MVHSLETFRSAVPFVETFDGRWCRGAAGSRKQDRSMQRRSPTCSSRRQASSRWPVSVVTVAIVAVCTGGCAPVVVCVSCGLAWFTPFGCVCVRVRARACVCSFVCLFVFVATRRARHSYQPFAALHYTIPPSPTPTRLPSALPPPACMALPLHSTRRCGQDARRGAVARVDSRLRLVRPRRRPLHQGWFVL
jgi:hypothetical protein